MRKKTIILFTCLLSISVHAQVHDIIITDASSLVRVGMNPHPTEVGDTALAYTLRRALDNADIDSVNYVCKRYEERADNEKTKEKVWSSLAYILHRMVQERQGAHLNSGDVLTEDLYHYFTDNECSHLRNYLLLKYNLDNYRPQSVKEYINQRTFYDDLLMFNDPYRDKWDKTETIMQNMPIKKGDTVVDVGCGFGYNAYRLLKLVGDKGTVYATDTEESYSQHLQAAMTRGGISNLKALHTHSDSLGVEQQVDCIFMSSLYHIIYTWSREDERSAFLKSVKKHLKHNGFLVIVDNNNLHGEELNNCHVDYQLVQAQLGFWGFRPVSHTKLNVQRYMLILQRDDNYIPQSAVETKGNHPVLRITSQKSVVHIGSLDSYDITDRGIDAASHVYDFVGGGDSSLGEIAIKKYDELIPSENFGGEYSALQWLCEVLLADSTKKEEMLRDPLDRSFFHKMTDDSCKTLRYYLLHKYKLGNDSIRMLSDSLLELSGEVGRTHRSYLEDYILALNPKRPNWENTSEILRLSSIKPGDKVADIGCGSGYFTFRFSKEVGQDGHVYALEIKDEHLATLQSFLQEESITNVDTVKGHEEFLALPEQVDKMFMCSLYHIMYGVVSDSDRDAYLKTLVQWLKPNGELIIVDNGPVDDNTLPYHGPYILPELIEHQLSFYGLKCVERHQIIPQRYLLKFIKI